MNHHQTGLTRKPLNPRKIILQCDDIVFFLVDVGCLLVTMSGQTTAFYSALNSSTAILPAVLANQISASLTASFIAVPFGLIGLALAVIANTRAR
ncbi:MAG: hypothetical protein CMJ77_16135 [Planctomycetaceae bacterium]|nr:hypothetical protein [Planctomycetaceae bacterium]